MRGALVAMPTFATAQFRRFFECGRALIKCLLSLGSGGFMNLVVPYGYQGADTDAEQFAFTEQLFDARELGVVARGEQPSLVVVDFNVEPIQIPCMCQGISAGLWVDLEALGRWLGGFSQPPLVSVLGGCSTGDNRRDIMVGCPLATAAVSSCRVDPGRWIAPHVAVRAHFDCVRWTCQVTLHLAVMECFDCHRWICRVTQPIQRTHLWPAAWLSAVDKSRSSESAELQRVWEVYGDRLQYMAMPDVLPLDESLLEDDVSRTCYGLVWGCGGCPR